MDNKIKNCLICCKPDNKCLSYYDLTPKDSSVGISVDKILCVECTLIHGNDYCHEKLAEYAEEKGLKR